MNEKQVQACTIVELSDEDVLKAMKGMHGHIDITPADFREVYKAAYGLALERMRHALKAGDVMTRPVYTIHHLTDSIDTALMLADKGISGAPVVDDDGIVVGMVSEKDFLALLGAHRTRSFMEVVAQCLGNRGCLATPLRKLNAAQIMTKPAVTAPPEMSVAKISKRLMENKINRLPIVDTVGRPVGIVTRSDLVRSYCQAG